MINFMNTKTLTKPYRIALASLGLAAITTDLIHGITTIAGFSVVNYFSFFTILSTLFTSVILLVAVFYKDIPILRGAATLFMLITGIVYFFLLRHEPIQIVWVNTAFHYILPIAVMIDWLVHAPSRRIPFGTSLVWLLFPVAFLAYSLVRGFFTNWYPYPFMDVASLGYGQTFINVIFVGLGMAMLALAVNGLHRLRLHWLR